MFVHIKIWTYPAAGPQVHARKHERLRPQLVCLAQELQVPPSFASKVEPDLRLTMSESNSIIDVFGVEHVLPQPHIGRWNMFCRNRT